MTHIGSRLLLQGVTLLVLLVLAFAILDRAATLVPDLPLIATELAKATLAIGATYFTGWAADIRKHRRSAADYSLLHARFKHLAETADSLIRGGATALHELDAAKPVVALHDLNAQHRTFADMRDRFLQHTLEADAVVTISRDLETTHRLALAAPMSELAGRSQLLIRASRAASPVEMLRILQTGDSSVQDS